MILTAIRKFTVEDYYLLMSKLGDYFEYANGEITSKYGEEPLPTDVIEYVLSADFDAKDFTFPIDMPTKKHQTIGANTIIFIGQILKKEKKFFIYGDGTKILIAEKGTYRIPDLVIAEKSTEIFDKNDQLINPVLIVEIWSPSTDYKDRGIKLREYQSIPSLQEYVMISQEEARIEHFIRQDSSNNAWIYKVYDQLFTQISLPTIDVSILLSEIYADIEFAL
jgi:Uma2 family endonuclease